MSETPRKKKYILFDRSSKVGKFLSTWQSLHIGLFHNPTLPPYEVIEEDDGSVLVVFHYDEVSVRKWEELSPVPSSLRPDAEADGGRLGQGSEPRSGGEVFLDLYGGHISSQGGLRSNEDAQDLPS
jgi:hypothetical protein